MQKAYNGQARPIKVQFQLVRNVTSPEEKQNGVMTYFANIPAFELEKVDTEDNLRDYIPGADMDDIKSGRRNHVHKAIENTIIESPDRFINRNGGVTITCSSVNVSDKDNTLELVDPSVINGAQTRGEIIRQKRLLEADAVEAGDTSKPRSPFNVRAEIIVDPDKGSVVETAIARNTASPVKSISQAGGRGQLDELDQVMFKSTGSHIRKSETDDDAVDTFMVLQAARLLMPSELAQSDAASEVLKPYKQRGNCLDDFTRWYQNRGTDEADKARYDFTLQIAPTALRELENWTAGSMFNHKGLRVETGKQNKRSFRRDGKGGQIVWASPGIVFPILSAFSEFVEREDDKWVLRKPEIFEEDELVDAAIEQWRALETDPMQMGRSAGAYAALRHITRTTKRAADRMKGLV
ncbi:MAG: AIPR family protein [Sulfitobacter pontiacus]|uniref:AIPR family protein n=1 Tax=Sulfitobacter pontiacus TaxID=60137 RepID=UPI0032988570